MMISVLLIKIESIQSASDIWENWIIYDKMKRFEVFISYILILILLFSYKKEYIQNNHLIMQYRWLISFNLSIVIHIKN